MFTFPSYKDTSSLAPASLISDFETSFSCNKCIFYWKFWSLWNFVNAAPLSIFLKNFKQFLNKICLNTKKELSFSPRTMANTFKNILRVLQLILSRSFLTLQKNLEYLQCASITREWTSVKKKLEFEKVDNLAGRFLKDGSNIPCTPIAKICNLFIKLASFQDKCKVTKIKPLYKKGLKTDPKNFRPISLLSLICKVIERIIHDQTMNLLSDNNVIYKYQSGFRKFHSTVTCLSYYVR